MHPLDPYLTAPLSLLEDLWISVAFTRCERAGCVATTNVPICLTVGRFALILS